MSNNTRHIVHRGRAQGPHPHANTVHYTQTGHTHPSPKLFTHRTCYSKQSACSRLANVESAAQLHMHSCMRGEESRQKRAQPQLSPGRVGSARQCRPRAAGIRATPAARAGMHLLRQLASIC